MKKGIAFLAALICLLMTGSIRAEDGALYPIRQGELWGYMNRQGETVIAPQWRQAWPFQGDTAMIATFARKNASEIVYGSGVIDRQGNLLVPPREGMTVEPYRYAYRVRLSEQQGGGEGFFDIGSGFYLPPSAEYSFVMLWNDDGSGPVAVENAEGMTGYLDRATGETAIPFRYTGESDDVGFVNGYALPANLKIYYNKNGEECGMGSEFHLIDAQGNEVAFPENIQPCSGVRGDRVVVYNTAEYDEDLQEPDWLTGLARPDGTLTATTEYWHIWEPDAMGMVCVLDDDRVGHMDADGQLIVPPRYVIDFGGAIPYYFFWNGYAVFEDCGENWPETARSVILTPDGEEIFSHPEKLENGDWWMLDDDVGVTEHGLLWYCCRPEDASWPQAKYGLMKVQGKTVTLLTDAIYESHIGGVLVSERYEDQIDFAEGLHPVKLEGKWGYINEDAELVIPPRWDKASSFRDGLALVEKDGKLSYIDRAGQTVWQEND